MPTPLDRKTPEWVLRNGRAETIIASYARAHAWIDVGVGAIGTFIPAAALPGLGACVLAQYPLVYRPLSRKLTAIYTDPLHDGAQQAGPTGWARAVSVEGAMALNPQNSPGLQQIYNLEIFLELAREYANEVGIGFALSLLPVIGGICGAVYDAKAATTMTWRVGTMISLFFQNGSDWIGDRKRTLEMAKEIVGPVSMKNAGRVKLDDVIP